MTVTRCGWCDLRHSQSHHSQPPHFPSACSCKLSVAAGSYSSSSISMAATSAANNLPRLFNGCFPLLYLATHTGRQNHFRHVSNRLSNRPPVTHPFPLAFPQVTRSPNIFSTSIVTNMLQSCYNPNCASNSAIRASRRRTFALSFFNLRNALANCPSYMRSRSRSHFPRRLFSFGLTHSK